MSPPPLRLGILGAGNVARRFIAAAKSSDRITIAGVASRDPAKARAFAGEVGVLGAYGSYEALLADPAVEAVYVPLPNSLHAEWAIRAVEAGKHVLCEKPISVTAAEAKAMFAAAKKAGVHLVEAYPYMAQPQTIAMRRLLREGAIGRLGLIEASFGFIVQSPATDIRLVADLGGGARFDAGSYPISLMRVAAGERPSRVRAECIWHSEGVDRTTTIAVQFPSGILAQIACSLDIGFHRSAFIGGDAGAIVTDFSNHGTPDKPLELQVKQTKALNTPFEIQNFIGTNGFLAEAESFAALVAGEKDGWTGVTPEESIDIMLIIDAVSESLRTGGWVELGA